VKGGNQMKQLSNLYVGGTISEATMRSEDLIPKFMDFLEDVAERCEIREEVASLREEVYKLELEDEEGYGAYYKDQEQAGLILNEGIWDLMNSITPEFCYFGSHEGDGACYGFWTSDEALQEALMEMIGGLEPVPELGDFRELAEDIIELLDRHSR